MIDEQAQEIANLKDLIKGHEIRHEQNISIKKNLTKQVGEQQKRIEGAYKSGFHDGRYGTPCEFVRLSDEKEALQKQADAALAIIDSPRYHNREWKDDISKALRGDL